MRDEDRYLGCLLGLAVGDALGTTVEFAPRGSFEPVADLVGGGPFDLAPGEWTDDTSMALCLATSLVRSGGFDPADQMNRYRAWQEQGYLSSNGRCFDIGGTVAAALRRYRESGDPWSGSTDPRSAGNGAIMRLAPVPMFFAASLEHTIHFSGESARTTHGASEALDCTRLFGAQLRAALTGASKEEIFARPGYAPCEPAVRRLVEGAWVAKPEAAIRGSGYIVESLEAALWCFARSDSWTDAVLRAVNLGDDADTTAAICGQLAGAHYGVGAIPAAWRAKLAMRAEIESLACELLRMRQA
ncbi:MAG TPA: ADP-ribosylglycohydrolase family protein [Myxococcota bacterium]|nr:ADP-ribosylglycohydrolase family protein [Myxococcota bacterium]